MVDVRGFKQNKKMELEGAKGTQKNQDIRGRRDWVVEEFKPLFQGIGRYKGPPVQIQVRSAARPVIQLPRRIPLH